MRLLIISHSFYPDIGGIETFSEIIANYFHKNNIEIHLLTWTKKKGPKDFPYGIIRNPDLLTLVKEHIWADVVFENNPALRLSWPNYFSKKPNIIAVQTWLCRTNSYISWQERLKKEWLQRANKVVAISEKIRKTTFEDAKIIPNCYDSDIFYRRPNISKEKDFVFLGRLVSDKGADMAVELLKDLRSDKNEDSRFRNINLTIIGDGPEKNEIVNLIEEYNLKDYVNFTGFLKGEALSKELNRHKYLLVPSRWEEPFGIVALEGMACGCLPIVSNGGGLPEAVGEAGVTFERNSLNSLIDVVKKLLDQPELEMKYRRKSEEHLAQHTSEVIAERYFKIIQNSLKT